jgi:hypothetical protein
VRVWAMSNDGFRMSNAPNSTGWFADGEGIIHGNRPGP